MAPSTDSPWPPSFPRDVASTVVASVQHVTSSVRLLLVGCFQCQSLRIGCWRRQEEPDGAWFDCEKVGSQLCEKGPEDGAVSRFCHPRSLRDLLHFFMLHYNSTSSLPE